MASGSILRRPAFLLALCLCSVGAVVTLLGRLATGPAVALKPAEITNEPGAKAYPSFSPDGKRLAYSVRNGSADAGTFHVFVRDLPGGAPRQLTHGPTNDVDPVWSPDGANLAFVSISADGSECVVIPAIGPGEPRRIPGCSAPGDETQAFPAIAWTRDGKSLVVVQTAANRPPGLALLSLDSGTLRPLTEPPAGTDGDSQPAVSPDGTTLAFVRASNSEGADIYLCNLNGANPRRLTFDDRAIRGLSWGRDGQDLIYAGNRGSGWRIWRLPAHGGSPHDLVLPGKQAQYAAVAPAGSRLAYTVGSTLSAVWRASLERPGEEREIVRSAGSETSPRYSPDGKRIAEISDQTGFDEVWLCDSDGGNRVRITDLKGPDLARLRWSPDGKSLLFDAAGDRGYDLYSVAAAAGARPAVAQMGALNGSWSHDGKSIYFQMRGQIWRAARDGGSPEQLSHVPGAAQPVESADGRFVYFRNRRSFWRIPVEGGEAEEVIIPDHGLPMATTIQLTARGLYYLEFERSAREMVVSFYDFAQKRSATVFRMKNPDTQHATYSVSPDGKWILYPRIDQNQTDLVIVDHFR